MCGRTCLTLEPNEVCCACKYKATTKESTSHSNVKEENKQKCSPQKMKCTEDTNYLFPEWREEFNFGLKYVPSYNIAPTDLTPVLVSSKHFCDDNETDVKGVQTHIIVPMLWGMIPFWHKGDYRKHGLQTNNSRLENMLESKLYRGPFRRGQRCVMICEGLYEWQTTKSQKSSERAAYFIYMPQSDGIKIYDKQTWTSNSVNLLKMAGIFDVWNDENGDKIYCFSVITFESTKILSWLHHRMPAILETEQQVNDWLDFNRVTDEQALAQLTPAKNLQWHRVSNIVNNSRNKSNQCNKPIELVQKSNSGQKQTMLTSWLKAPKIDENIINSNELSDGEKGSEPKYPRYDLSKGTKESEINND